MASSSSGQWAGRLASTHTRDGGLWPVLLGARAQQDYGVNTLMLTWGAHNQVHRESTIKGLVSCPTLHGQNGLSIRRSVAVQHR